MNSNDTERLQRHLTAALAEFDSGCGQAEPQVVLESLLRAALKRLRAATWASVTTRDTGAFTTAASSDGPARAIDRMQREVGHGPALEVPPFSRSAGYL